MDSYHNLSSPMHQSPTPTSTNQNNSNPSPTSSKGSNTERKYSFGCYFDPSLRHRRFLVLQFDIEGQCSFQEYSRDDILQLIREAEQTSPHISPTGTDENINERNSWDEKVGTSKEIMSKFQQRRRRSLALSPENNSTLWDIQPVHTRDIRNFNDVFAVSDNPRLILRQQALLLHADPIRAIILRYMCLIFVPDGADSLLLVLQRQFHAACSHTSENPLTTPYEIRAIEALFGTLCETFCDKLETLSTSVTQSLHELLDHEKKKYVHNLISNDMDKMDRMKTNAKDLETQIASICQMLMDILDQEDSPWTLRYFQLTLFHKMPWYLHDVQSFQTVEFEAVENLLEMYLQQILALRTKIQLLSNRITNAESTVNLQLDAVRNRLLGIDIKFSLVNLSLLIGTSVTGIFGMNLNTTTGEDGGFVGDEVFEFWRLLVGLLVMMVVIVGGGVSYIRWKGVSLE